MGVERNCLKNDSVREPKYLENLVLKIFIKLFGEGIFSKLYFPVVPKIEIYGTLCDKCTNVFGFHL